MTRDWPEHGELEISLQGAVVVTHLVGPWNAELMKRWVQALEPYSSQARAQGPYAGMTVVRGSVLCPPDALDLMRQRTQWSVARFPYVGTALVVAPDVEGRGLAGPVFEPVFAGLCPFRLFDEAEDAQSWLQQLIDQARATTPNTP